MPWKPRDAKAVGLLSQVQAGRHRRPLGPVSVAPGHMLTTPTGASSGLALPRLSAASAEQQDPQDAAPWALAALAASPGVHACPGARGNHVGAGRTPLQLAAREG